jgi:hypothetical protein
VVYQIVCANDFVIKTVADLYVENGDGYHSSASTSCLKPAQKKEVKKLKIQ